MKRNRSFTAVDGGQDVDNAGEEEFGQTGKDSVSI